MLLLEDLAGFRGGAHVRDLDWMSAAGQPDGYLQLSDDYVSFDPRALLRQGQILDIGTEPHSVCDSRVRVRAVRSSPAA